MKKETKFSLKGKSLIETSQLYVPGTLVEVCSVGDRITKRKISKYYPQLEAMGHLGVLCSNFYVRMEFGSLPSSEKESMSIGRMNNLPYRDGSRNWMKYVESPFSESWLPIGALGFIVRYIRVRRPSHQYLEEIKLPSLESPHFYIVYFDDWLNLIKAGHYLIPTNELKKAEPREKYIDGIAIEPW